MKIVQLHNRYKSLGGEDTMLELERDMLLTGGHLVSQVKVSNEILEVDGISASITSGLGTVWSQRAYRALDDTLRQERPDLLHVHNTFPQLSPSVYWAATRLGIPVVQTLHNYRT